MKVLLFAAVLAISSVSFAAETVKSTTTTKHAVDHTHVEEGKAADHAHDDAHHAGAVKVEDSKKVESKKVTK